MKLDIWGAEKNWLINYISERAIFMMNKTREEIKAAPADYYLELPENKTDFPSILTIDGDTADIQIRGRLSQDGPDRWDRMFGFDGTGYNEIIAAADEIKENAQIKKVNLLIDSPGGRFKGVDNAWKALMSLRTGRKITAVNEGVMMSGGYYLASAAHKIHSTSETNGVGSIGVIIAGTDWSKYDKERGIKDVIIVSKNAPDKYADISTKKGRGLLQEQVDQAESFFLNRIAKGRGLEIDYITENFGRGGIMFSKSLDEETTDALSVKMIDKVLNVVDGGSKSASGESRTQAGAINQGAGGESPVSANNEQEKIMTFQEFLAANPEAKAEYDRQLQAKYDSGSVEGKKTGITEGKETVQNRIKKAFGFMGENCVYPVQIQNMIVATAKGETSMETLEAVIATEDIRIEREKSVAGKKETDENGETPPNQPTPTPIDGKVETPEQFGAFQQLLRQSKGLKSPKQIEQKEEA